MHQTNRHTLRRLLLPGLALLLTLLLCLAACLLCTGSIAALLPPLASCAPASQPTASADPISPPFTRVVLDAGHGGEDSGAQSAAGLYEKDVNLAVAFCLRDYLEAAGIPTVMTRTQDRLLYNPTDSYRGKKKILDLAARLEIARSVPDSLFVSIHMNSFPQAKYSGIQVWYSPADPESARVASGIQTQALRLAPDNRRKPQAAGSNIFLLDRLDSPAVLVEGGFLSNPEEAARLGTEAYRRRLAFVLFLAIMQEMQEPTGTGIG